MDARTEPAVRKVNLRTANGGFLTLSRKINSIKVVIHNPSASGVNVDELKEGIEEVMKDE